MIFAFVAAALASAPGYELSPVADAGPGSGSGFLQIASADINASGVVVFTAVDADGRPGVYTSDGKTVTPIATFAQGFDSAYSAVINDAGEVAFVGTNVDVVNGVLLHGPGGFEIFGDAASLGADVLGQLCIGNDAAPSVVYWSSCFGVIDCTTAQQCIGFANVPSPFTCEPTDGAALAAPALGGAGTVAFLRSVPDGATNRLRLEVWDPSVGPIVQLDVDQKLGFISSPSIAPGGDVAVYAGDKPSGLADAIYRIAPGVDGPQTIDMVVGLDGTGPQTPLLTTQPFINAEDVVAYVAEFQPETPALAGGGGAPVEAIFAGDVMMPCPIVAEGEPLLGSTLVGDLQLFGLNDAGSMVATADLADGREVLVLIADDGCSGDVDGSGEVDVSDLIQIILDWMALGCGLDVDNDGVIDKDDLLAIIDQWGPCE